MKNKLFRWYLKIHQKAIQSHYQSPLALQAKELQLILNDNKNTLFGKQYNFSTIKTYQQFIHHIPVGHYSDLEPYIQRITSQQKNVLTKAPVTWLAQTAGTTTGQHKHIPITEKNIRRGHFRGSWYSLASLYAHNKNLKIFAQKNLLIGGGVYKNYPNTDIRVADISGVLITKIPRILQQFYVPEIAIATLPDYEEKIRKTADIVAYNDKITMLGGTPTWNLSLYRRVLELRNAKNLLEVWPKLQAYIHGGVRLTPYREHFKQLIPSEHFLYHEVYTASEGYFAVQDQLDRDDLLLILNNGTFYEFILLDDYLQQEMDAIPLAEVSTGKAYVMLITNNSGLYRYVLGDVVTFTSTFPFKIRVTGRTQEFINAFGEDLQLEQVEKALAYTCHQLGVIINDYSIAPQYLNIKDRGYHQWFIAFARPPENIGRFVTLLDQRLQLENTNYAQKRSNNFALKILEVIPLAPGFFDSWLKNTKHINGQTKVPRLVNNRKVANSILLFLQHPQKT